jgi:signal transduction histidine kinase
MPEPAHIIDETPSPAQRRAPIRFLWRANAEARFTEVSPELARALGQEAASILGRTWTELCASLVDDPDGEVARRFKERQTWSGQLVYWSSGTRQVPVEFAGQPILDGNRALVGFRGFGLIRPESARPMPRRAPEPVLVPRSEPISGETRGTGGGSWFSDIRQRLLAHLGAARPVEANKTPSRAGRVNPEPLPQKPAPEHRRSEAGLSDAERNAFSEIARALGQAVPDEATTAPNPAAETEAPPDVDAERVPAETEALKARLRDFEGQLETARRELAAAQQRLESANAGKADLLARMAQETRAPLEAVIAFSGGMLEERLGPLGSESYKTYLKDIRASALRVFELIEDLSELAKIEAGRVALSPGAVSLNELIESCVREVQPRAMGERVLIRTSLAAELPPALFDASAVKQVAANLLANAVAATTAGGHVIVSTWSTGEGEVAFRLRDGGPAMSEAEIAAALEPFRLPGGPSQAGFGLSRAKAVVEANGGRLAVSTGSGVGTLIEIVFPAAASR